MSIDQLKLYQLWNKNGVSPIQHSLSSVAPMRILSSIEPERLSPIAPEFEAKKQKNNAKYIKCKLDYLFSAFACVYLCYRCQWL